MVEREDAAGPDARLDGLLERSGWVWPGDEGQLDSWLAAQPLADDEQRWLRDVIRRRMVEAAANPPVASTLSAVSPGAADRPASIGLPVAEPAPDAPTKERPPRRPTRRLTPADLALLDAELLALVEARVPLPVGLQAVARGLRDGALTDVIEDLRRDLDLGVPLSDALARRGEALPPVYGALVAAGEAGGDVTGALALLREQAEVDQELDRRVRESLVYPAVTAAVAVLGVGLGLLFLGPTYASLFAEMGVALPVPTSVLLETTRLLHEHLWAALPLALILAVAGRASFERLVPIVRRAMLGRNAGTRGLAELSRALSGLMRRGVPLPVALRALEGGLPGFAPGALQGLVERLEEGARLGDVLAGRRDLFPPTFAWLVAAAEDRGDLPDALHALALRYESEFLARVRVTHTLVGPLVLTAVGLGVGAMAVALYLPLFQLQHALPYLVLGGSMNAFDLELVLLPPAVATSVALVLAATRPPAPSLALREWLLEHLTLAARLELPLGDALSALARERRPEPSRSVFFRARRRRAARDAEVLERLAARLDATGSLATALEGSPDLVAPGTLSTVRAAERGGGLPALLAALHEEEAQRRRSRWALVDLLAYPVLLTGFVLALTLFLGAAVYPKLAALSADLRTESSFLGANVASFLASGAVSAAALVALTLRGGGRPAAALRWAARPLAESLPRLGPAWRTLGHARALGRLGALVGGGVPLPEALRAVASAEGAPARRRLERAAALSAEGHPLERVLRELLGREAPALGDSLQIAIHAAGSLAAGLEHGAARLNERARGQLLTLREALRPLPVLALGGVVATHLATTFQVLFDAQDLLLGAL